MFTLFLPQYTLTGAKNGERQLFYAKGSFIFGKKKQLPPPIVPTPLLPLFNLDKLEDNLFECLKISAKMSMILCPKSLCIIVAPMTLQIVYYLHISVTYTY